MYLGMIQKKVMLEDTIVIRQIHCSRSSNGKLSHRRTSKEMVCREGVYVDQEVASVSEITVACISFGPLCIQTRHVWLGSQGAFNCLQRTMFTMLSIL